MKRRALFLLCVILSFATPAIAQHAEILSGEATVTRNGQQFAAKRGIRLVEGDRLAIPSQVQFLGDYGSFVASQKTGMIDFTLLRRESGCSRTFISYLGKLRITPRPLTCSRSIIQVHSLASGGSYTFRGTDAFLSDNGKKSQILVTKGVVDTQSVGVVVAVPAGFGNQITEGLPPEPPTAIEFPSLGKLRIEKLPWGVKLHLNTNPLNEVFVQGVGVTQDAEVLIYYPILGNALKIEVVNPLGISKTFIYPLPTRK